MKTLILVSLLALPAVAQLPPDNPFAAESTLPYQAPPFDKIKDEHYQPALEEGMRQELADMEAIANSTAAPTFENTIVAMEKAGPLLRRAQRAFGAMTQANTNPTLQKVQSELAPKQAAHRDAIYLNPKLFARVKAVYDQRASLKLTPEAKNLLEDYYDNFVRSGALLSEADKETLRGLNKESSKLTSDFRNKLLADTNASALVIDDVKELDGLPQADIDAAASAAKSRGLTGKWVLTLQNTTQQPALTYLKNRAVRERLYRASMMRGSHGGDNDVTAIVARLAQLRAQRAKLLGFPNYAAYGTADQMSKTPETAIKFMADIVPAATAKARAEAARMQKMIGNEFKLEPWDWQYYSEQVRKADYDLDDEEVRQYFELDRVLNDGVFFAAKKLYGLTFKPRKDIPVYQPDVRVWEVIDHDGKGLALYYLDPFSRSNKAGGAWSGTFVSQNKLFGTKTVNYNVENMTKPAEGQPALITLSNMRTLFHEFGHSLHAIFSNIEYPGSGGTPRDWVEFPSQFNEHWAMEPTVFANFAKHYKTGKPMPKALVNKIKKASTFNQGFATTEALAAALLDMGWHTLPADAPLTADVNAFERAALEKYGVMMDEVPPRYRTGYFSHIWNGGYAAAYYAYMWTEVLDHDAFYWFKENGGMTRANGDRFRKMILSRGGTQDPAEMYRAFRGRDPKVEPLLIERGLK